MNNKMQFVLINYKLNQSFTIQASSLLDAIKQAMFIVKTTYKHLDLSFNIESEWHVLRWNMCKP